MRFFDKTFQADSGFEGRPHPIWGRVASNIARAGETEARPAALPRLLVLGHPGLAFLDTGSRCGGSPMTLDSTLSFECLLT